MAKKILIFGATGSVGSSLAKLVKESSLDAHLIGKNEGEISKLKDQTGFTCSIADVTDTNFLEIIDKDLAGSEISGIAYCVGSIDLKPINLVSKKDYLKKLIKKKKTIFSREEKKKISDIQESLELGESGFSEDYVIHIEKLGHEYDLTLIDLPGLVDVSDKKEIHDTYKIYEKYTEMNATIIFHIVEVNGANKISELV